MYDECSTIVSAFRRSSSPAMQVILPEREFLLLMPGGPSRSTLRHSGIEAHTTSAPAVSLLRVNGDIQFPSAPSPGPRGRGISFRKVKFNVPGHSRARKVPWHCSWDIYFAVIGLFSCCSQILLPRMDERPA
ncbi:unnamed protein product [Caretta caretta]